MTSLAVSKSGDNAVTVLAGINSSQAQQQRDNNKHLRAFQIDYAPKKNADPEDTSSAADEKGEAKITALSQASVFKTQATKATEQREIYQRLARLSRWNGPEDTGRVAMISTGLAPRGEIVLLKADSAASGKPEVLSRLMLANKEEAEDMDIIETKEEGEFNFAYTDGASLYTGGVSGSVKSDPDVKLIYTVEGKSSGGPKSKIRALRFLSPTSLLLLQNLPGRTGCELVVVSLRKQSSQYVVVQKKRLRSSVKIGLGLDVCHLSESSKGEKQYIIAVSGSDLSIDLFTLGYAPKGGFQKVKRYTTLSNVHPVTMTRIAFSTFTPPSNPVTPDVMPQYVKLASVSVGNTVVVHTLPLSPYPGDSTNPRYVLVNPGIPQAIYTLLGAIVTIFIVAIAAFTIQAFTEIRGGVPPTLGATEWLSPRLRELIAQPYIFESKNITWGSRRDPGLRVASPSVDIPEAPIVNQPLKTLISFVRSAQEDVEGGSTSEGSGTPGLILVRDMGGEVAVDIVGETEKDSFSDATKWEELSAEEREAWKQKLVDAGEWSAEDDDEAVLQGVLFGKLASFVGRSEL